MTLNISKGLLKEMKKNYFSVEYVIGEVLPMITSASLKNVPPFFLNDDTETIDFADDVANEIEKVFSNQWKLEDCVQFLLAWGILMEV